MNPLLRLLATIVAVATGLLTLLGLLSDDSRFTAITDVFLQWALIGVALTILLGIVNLFSVHLRRIVTRQRGFVYSMVLIIGAALVIVLWLLGADTESRMVLETVVVSVESALAALLVFTLVYGAYRLMRQRVTVSALLFTIALLILLLGALPLTQTGALVQIRTWLLAVPVSAGARGILLGIALGTVITGVRVLTGQERAYRE